MAYKQKHHIHKKGLTESDAVIPVDGAQTEGYHIPLNDCKEIKGKQIRALIQQSCALEKIICLNNGLTMIWAPYTFIAAVTKPDEIVPSKFLVVLAICFNLILFIIKAQTHYLQLRFMSDVRSMGRYLLVSLLQIPLVSYILFSLQAPSPMDLLLQVIVLLLIILVCVFCVVEIKKEWKRRQDGRLIMS